MMGALICIWAGLVGFSPDDRSEYQAAAAKAGSDAGAHLKLAVWCEAHGLDSERLKHLARAMALDPQDPAVRGMLGLVSYGGKWMPPTKVGEAVKSDDEIAAKLAEYEARRQKTPQFAQAQWDLADWCEKNGLKAEAMAHYTAVTQIDPKRADAWRKLGCELSHGKWIPAEQAAARRAEEDAQREADHYWEPILRYWRGALDDQGPRHSEAVDALKQINDPRAVPMIHRVFARGSKRHQEMAAEMLARIQCPASSHALVALALHEQWPEGRSFAINELKRRDPREYVGELVALMHKPFAYKITPAGLRGEPAQLVIDGDQSQIQRYYRLAPAARRRMLFERGIVAPRVGVAGAMPPRGVGGGLTPIGQDQTGIGRFLAGVPDGALDPETRDTLQGRANVQIAAAALPAPGASPPMMAQDVATIESFNRAIRQDNRVVAATLTEITAQNLGDDPEAWRTWWTDKLGLRYETAQPKYKKRTVQFVTVPYVIHHACFAAGTPVPTLTGPRPIESLQLGDLLLSQDTTTGVLSYQPIVGVHHNPPAETVRLRFKDETIVCTPVHRFWRPGRGWAMARDLKPGERVRTVGGRAEVLEVTPQPVQPVFNLDIARNNTFFVGNTALLVRDNSLPPAMYTRFDAEPSLAALFQKPASGPQGSGGAHAKPSMLSTGRKESQRKDADSIWDSPAEGTRGGAMLPVRKNAKPAGKGSFWD